MFEGSADRNVIRYLIELDIPNLRSDVLHTLTNDCIEVQVTCVRAKVKWSLCIFMTQKGKTAYVFSLLVTKL